MMIIADKLEELVKMQVEAIKNIKIDKVTVWEGGQEKGENSKSSTANFISNLYRSVPPMQDIFDMAGMNLPQYLGTQHDDRLQTKETLWAARFSEDLANSGE